MKLFPAIDLRGGRVVRLTQGDYGRMTVYGDDPAAQAAAFRQAGADCLHLVDLDGAKDGAPANFEAIRAIARQGSFYIEVGGGIRTEARIEEYLALGVGRCILGSVALNYFLIFPLTFRFLSTYQVSSEIANLISIDSYLDSLILLCLAMGVFFELPILCILLSKAGILSAKMMRDKRRYAIVIILTAAAFITPTSDVFTLMIVALPVYLLYEVSILLISKRS